MRLEEIKEITERQRQALEKNHIETVEDLLELVPRKYYDFSSVAWLTPGIHGTSCSLIGTVEKIKTTVKSCVYTCMTVTDVNTGKLVDIKWYNQRFREKQYKGLLKKKVVVCGAIMYDEIYDKYSITTPVVVTEYKDDYAGNPVYPVYKAVKGISDDGIKTCMRQALMYYRTEDNLPAWIIEKYKLLDMRSAYYHIHFPENKECIRQARKRFVFNDLLKFAISLEMKNRDMSLGSSFVLKNTSILRAIEDDLDYELTKGDGKEIGGQKDAVEEIISSMKTGRRVDAVIQGDVGCGKTIVAIMALMVVAANRGQAALLASTSVLAYQHYKEIKEIADKYHITTAYLDGSTKTREKRSILKGIAEGSISIVVGTHSIFSDDVLYRNLKLVIMDEEHKYGVQQRAALIKKGGTGVHVISMSATPIPRSLASTIYSGRRQMITINIMPGNRIPIKTAIYNEQDKILRFVAKQLDAGHQAYVVCPLVQQQNEGEVEVVSAEKMAETYRLYFNGTRKVELLTGRTKKSEAEDIMRRYKEGDVSVLVSTTVIEVGVNVPNATVIVISNAERFGLASLHQLRGRVGRGKYQSYCILQTQELGNERLKCIWETTDGFKIAQKDMELRGAGNLVGNEQSGNDRYLAEALTYPHMFSVAKQLAEQMVDNGEADKYMLSLVVNV